MTDPFMPNNEKLIAHYIFRAVRNVMESGCKNKHKVCDDNTKLRQI